MCERAGNVSYIILSEQYHNLPSHHSLLDITLHISNLSDIVCAIVYVCVSMLCNKYASAREDAMGDSVLVGPVDGLARAPRHIARSPYVICPAHTADEIY